MLTGSQVILGLCLKHNNDWNAVYSELQSRQHHTNDEELERYVRNFHGNYITMLDADYPNRLKQKFKPPFVLYYEGDINLLKHVDDNDGKNHLVFLHGPNTFNIPTDRLCFITADNKVDICGGLRVWFNKQSDSVDRYGLAAGLCHSIVGTKIYPENTRSWFIGVTVPNALDLGAEVYMVASTAPSFNNRLIKSGAHLIDCFADICDDAPFNNLPF